MDMLLEGYEHLGAVEGKWTSKSKPSSSRRRKVHIEAMASAGETPFEFLTSVAHVALPYRTNDVIDIVDVLSFPLTEDSL